MKNHLTRVTVTQVGTKVRLGAAQPQPSPERLYQWHYRFEDGSCLVGEVKAQLDRDGNTLLNPTHISANYIDTDGKTLLSKWEDKDFACFEASIDGKSLVVVASNDNFVSNSMCLIESVGRSCAQVTDFGPQLVKEPVRRKAWSLYPKPPSVSSPALEVDWRVAPLFPFMSVSFNFQYFDSNTVFRWTYFPCLSPFPFVQVRKKTAP